MSAVWKRRLWQVLAGVVAVVVLAAGYGVWQVFRTADGMYQPVERLPSEVRPAPAAPVAPGGNDAQPANGPEAAPHGAETFLILGVDKQNGTSDTGRTDVIMLAVVNDQTGQVTLLSIPRDTYVEIAGKGYRDKINHSFQYGVATTIATVENYAGVPVDHYVLFDFQGFVQAVDALGGVQVDVDERVAVTLKKEPGVHVLNGQEALIYARFRSDARGDFGRNERQQNVLKAFLDQSREVRSPLKMQEMLTALGGQVRTDLTVGEMTSLATWVTNFSSRQVQALHLTGQGMIMGPQNLWYLVVPEAEQERVRQALQAARAERAT